MIDVDPRLDSKLQAFFEHIEASTPPARIDSFDPERPARTRSRVFNMAVATTAIAVVAAAVIGFALELKAHLPGPASATPGQTTPAPSASPTSAVRPPLDNPGNPVANAGFEEPQVGQITSVNPISPMPGWTVTGSVQLVPLGTVGQPSSGNQYLLLNISDGVAGRISQQVKTVPGVNYALIFSTGSNPECAGSATVDVFWNGRWVSGMETTPSTHPSPAPGDLSWSTDGFASALATGTTSTIGFAAAGQCGAALDDVVLQAEPLPGS